MFGYSGAEWDCWYLCYNLCVIMSMRYTVHTNKLLPRDLALIKEKGKRRKERKKCDLLLSFLLHNFFVQQYHVLSTKGSLPDIKRFV